MGPKPTAGIALAPWEREPYKLVSLGDILSGTIGTLEDGVDFLETIDGLHTLKGLQTDDVIAALKKLEAGFTVYGMRSSLSALKPMLHVVVRQNANLKGHSEPWVAAEAGKLATVVRHELDGIHFLHLHPQHAVLYENEHPFGEVVEKAFPSCKYDIGECAKCLAVYRPTAAVLHAMRCLELVARAVARRLNVDSNACETYNVGNLIIEMNRNIKAMKPAVKATVADLERNDHLSGVVFALEQAKDAWRNATAHARVKFTPEEADAVCGDIKRLMERIAKDTTLHELVPQVEEP